MEEKILKYALFDDARGSVKCCQKKLKRSQNVFQTFKINIFPKTLITI